MSALAELTDLVARNAVDDGVHETAIPRLALTRSAAPTEALHALHEPAVCIVVQGRKRVLLGDRVYEYDRNRYLTVSVDVPIVGQVIEASAERPYLCLRLDLDPAMLAALWMEMGATPAAATSDPSLMLGDLQPELVDAALRLLRLLRTPDDIALLAPLVEREILYRLMKGEQGSRLREIAQADSRLGQIQRAIAWIKRHFRDPFDLAELAAQARMSPSALHAHFKSVTRMSPLQFQKQLRLQEARKLMLSRALDAASAGYAVGYDSPSQFSREYNRLFGAPPLRDVARLRRTPEALYSG
ncbi:AraC family transcriptional regulator [Lysobacter antibioticus]|uniref:AraC family transcriptional regulator n=1 Tax=Lysobacter antibioticus TaxID=84531 RepID=UPI000345D14D|nr:AraC family transcriptional regulator [Lysobacter antibioticus]